MKPRVVHWLALLGVIVIAAALVAIKWYEQKELKRLPNERTVGAELVIEKLSGPRYFHAVGKEVGLDGEPVISPEEANAQIANILRERGWKEEEEKKLKRLIVRLTEQPDSRMVGSDRINLARLNLALDQLTGASEAHP